MSDNEKIAETRQSHHCGNPNTYHTQPNFKGPADIRIVEALRLAYQLFSSHCQWRKVGYCSIF